MTIIDVEELIIMYIYVCVLYSVFNYFFNPLGFWFFYRHLNLSAHCLYSYILKTMMQE